MFGIIRPCRNRLGEELRSAWLAHLCGLCLALRDDHGHLARIATNYDGLVVSALVEAQAPGGPDRRAAGPCPLRGMRTADVAHGAGARLAATVSLVLASAKVSDHIADGDGAFGRRGVRPAARRVAGRWARQGARVGGELGFDTALLVEAVERQEAVEASTGLGSSVLIVTEPTETATAAAFAHTAVLAGRPGNQEPLAEAGRMFGRVAHLLDAVEDLAEDEASGAWNPLPATGTDLAEARRLCAEALLGVRLALREAEFTDARLVHRLLDHELRHAVNRTFGTLPAGERHHDHARHPQQPYGSGGPYGQYPPQQGGYPPPYGQSGPYQGYPPPGQNFGGPPPPQPPRRRRQGCWASCCEGCCDGCTCCTCECCAESCCDCCSN